MHCEKCGTANPDDNRFCDACGASFDVACPACAHRNRSTARFCGGCGKPINGRAGAGPSIAPSPDPPASLQPLDGERKQVTVLFADIRGSMEMIDNIDPESALQRFDPAIQMMIESVQRYEGTVRVLGDGIMGLFGAPMAHEDHAAYACMAAKAMLDGIARLGDRSLQIRVGLNSGEVVVRSIASELFSEYDVIGSAAHLAHRIEQLAPAGTACMTANTLRLAKGYVHARLLETAEIRGVAAPVEIYQLTGVASRARWEIRSVANSLTRFVGRRLEIRTLATLLKRAEASRGQVIGIVGEAGIGKSRLIHEFIRSEHVAGWTVLRTDGIPIGHNSPFLLISNLLRSWIGVEEQDSKTQIADKLMAGLGALGAWAPADVTPLRSLLDLPISDAAWDKADPRARRTRILDSVKSLIYGMAASAPLILVVEDLHWTDAESAAALDAIIDGIVGARLLVLASYRPEYQHRWAARHHFSLLRLEGLETDAADELLRSLFGNDELESLRRRIIDHTDGTPLFLEELARDLLESGAVRMGANGSRVTRDIDTIHIPDSVHATLATRIDRLPQNQRALLHIASVIGKEFTLALLKDVAELSDEQLRKILSDMQALDLVYEINLPSGVEYRFKHALTQTVAYENMLLRHRRTLHARVLDAIEKNYPDRLDEFTERLALHAQRGEVWGRAAEYLYRAGHRANQRSAYREAIDFLEEAIAASKHLSETPANMRRAIAIYLALRVSNGALGMLTRVRECLEQAEALAAKCNDHQRLVSAKIGKCIILSHFGEPSKAIEEGEACRELAQGIGDIAHLANANFALGQAYWLRGDFAKAKSVLERDIAAVRSGLKTGDAGTTGTVSVLCLGCLGNSYALTGDFERAMEHGEEALAIARETSRPYDLAYAQVSIGLARLTRGDHAEAVKHCEEALHWARTGEIQLLELSVARYLGRALASQGRFEEAESLLLPACERAQEQSLHGLEGWCGVALGMTYVLSGRRGKAEEIGLKVLQMARGQEYRPIEVHALRLLVSCQSGNGEDYSTIESYCRDAIALAERLGMRPEAAHARRDLGLLLLRSGAVDEAYAELTAASRLYREMGMLGCAAGIEAAIKPPPGTDKIVVNAPVLQ